MIHRLRGFSQRLSGGLWGLEIQGEIRKFVLRTTLRRSSTWDETKEATAVDGASFSFAWIFAEVLGFEVSILGILSGIPFLSSWF
jgi:hypothetical protein